MGDIPQFLKNASTSCTAVVLIIVVVSSHLMITVIKKTPLAIDDVTVTTCDTPLELREIVSNPYHAADGYDGIFYDILLGLRNCNVSGKTIRAHESFGLRELAERRLHNYPNRTSVVVIYDYVFLEAWYNQIKDDLGFQARFMLAIIGIGSCLIITTIIFLATSQKYDGRAPDKKIRCTRVTS